ncbi:hypothetical protein L195_g043986 [Trifolium pratense]|uniref:Uncharacterized protein n=1 Tax=Trifolium pratense TaxID=57577 RepID=A0A2K3MAS8_TRIPR|nr:hypothetical protein L195_g043186 [Trifolium pratense]PNX87886.1 hypothetical protein L195_g043986 [Trifolium pratense]
MASLLNLVHHPASTSLSHSLPSSSSSSCFFPRNNINVFTPKGNKHIKPSSLIVKSAETDESITIPIPSNPFDTIPNLKLNLLGPFAWMMNV